MNHPHTLQTLVDDRLYNLRSEGLRSQELHRAGFRAGGPANLFKQIMGLFSRRTAGKAKDHLTPQTS